MFAPLFVYSYLTATMTNAKNAIAPRDERGASFTEYVVLIGAIVVVVTAGVGLLAVKINGKVNGLTL
jgi:Flp pilus assembly pilin Flp